MSEIISGKTITVKLDPEWRQALHVYRQLSPLHLSTAEQVRRALICYWVNSNNEAGARAINIIFDDDEEQVTVVPEGSAE